MPERDVPWQDARPACPSAERVPLPKLATPASAVAVGIVSNGGVAALLTWFGLTGGWAGRHPLVRIATWASAAVTLGIALGLYGFGMRHPAPARPPA